MEKDSKTEYFYNNIFQTIVDNREVYGWPEINKEDVIPTYMKALSNMTYKVDCKINNVRPLLAKRFGQGYLQELLDRDIDNAVSQFYGNQGVGPRVFYFSESHRIEEFVESTVFTAEDMANPKSRNFLAYYIAKLHSSTPPCLPQGSLFSRIRSNDIKLISLCLKSVESKRPQFTQEEEKKVNEILSLVSEEELEWLEAHTSKYNNELVGSHNDFLNGNILKLPNNQILLIDFEYSTFNLKMYDIANFITESLFDYDYQEFPYFQYYPEKRDSDEKVVEMMEYYLLFSKLQKDITVERAQELVDNKQLAREQLVGIYGSEDGLSKEISRYLDQLHIGYLLSHFYWSVWALVMCKNPNINFGYIEFAHDRLLDYRGIKNKYFQS